MEGARLADHTADHERVLNAAAELFYTRGIQAVGMAELRNTADIPLKRLYRCFASKQDIVRAYLQRRDQQWRRELSDYIARQAGTSEQRLLAVFDWLHNWFNDPGFHGCAFVNATGELGATDPAITRITANHKAALHAYLTELTRDLRPPDPNGLAGQLCLLIDGAITTATVTSDPATAAQARAAAATLISKPRNPSDTKAT